MLASCCKCDYTHHCMSTVCHPTGNCVATAKQARPAPREETSYRLHKHTGSCFDVISRCAVITQQLLALHTRTTASSTCMMSHSKACNLSQVHVHSSRQWTAVAVPSNPETCLIARQLQVCRIGEEGLTRIISQCETRSLAKEK